MASHEYAAEVLESVMDEFTKRARAAGNQAADEPDGSPFKDLALAEEHALRGALGYLEDRILTERNA